jgi:hypothetical protein
VGKADICSLDVNGRIKTKWVLSAFRDDSAVAAGLSNIERFYSGCIGCHVLTKFAVHPALSARAEYTRAFSCSDTRYVICSDDTSNISVPEIQRRHLFKNCCIQNRSDVNHVDYRLPRALRQTMLS